MALMKEKLLWLEKSEFRSYVIKSLALTDWAKIPVCSRSEICWTLAVGELWFEMVCLQIEASVGCGFSVRKSLMM